jgi:hypothetical protein
VSQFRQRATVRSHLWQESWRFGAVVAAAGAADDRASLIVMEDELGRPSRQRRVPELVTVGRAGSRIQSKSVWSVLSARGQDGVRALRVLGAS